MFALLHPSLGLRRVSKGKYRIDNGLESAVFKERQDLEQLPPPTHERSHQRKLPDENVADIDLSLPTASDSTVYQPSRRSHRAHALLPSSLTDMVEYYIRLMAICNPFDLSWNVSAMMVDGPVSPESSSLLEFLVISSSSDDLRT